MVFMAAVCRASRHGGPLVHIPVCQESEAETNKRGWTFAKACPWPDGSLFALSPHSTASVTFRSMPPAGTRCPNRFKPWRPPHWSLLAEAGSRIHRVLRTVEEGTHPQLEFSRLEAQTQGRA